MSKFEFRRFDIIISFVTEFEMFVSLCRNMLDRKGVLATKSHRGKYENMWNQIDNNFERKKFWKFFEIFEVKNLEIMSFYMLKNGFVSWYAQIKNVFWRLKVIGENKKTCENNLATILSKKNFDFFFFEIFEVRNFESMSFYMPKKWISSNFKVV